jgi:hypothetical protein
LINPGRRTASLAEAEVEVEAEVKAGAEADALARSPAALLLARVALVDAAGAVDAVFMVCDPIVNRGTAPRLVFRCS